LSWNNFLPVRAEANNVYGNVGKNFNQADVNDIVARLRAADGALLQYMLTDERVCLRAAINSLRLLSASDPTNFTVEQMSAINAGIILGEERYIYASLTFQERDAVVQELNEIAANARASATVVAISSRNRVFRPGVDLTTDISISNVNYANLISFIVDFDPSQVDELRFRSLDERLSIISSEYNGVTGRFTAVLRAENMFSTVASTPVLRFETVLSNSVVSGDVITSELTAVTVSEIVLRPGDTPTSFPIDPVRDPSAAATRAVDVCHFDINGNGRFDLADVGLIEYRFFGVHDGMALWTYAEPYDVDELVDIDGRRRIDIRDIMLLLAKLAANLPCNC
jgi:hypothetical protein